MSLIIGKEIQKLMVGYPTVSDKYDVAGGVLGGTVPAHFGDVLVISQSSGQSGVYEVPTGEISGVELIAGVACGTNVKLAAAYPGTDASVSYQVGEACNLCFKGFMAVALDATAVKADIKEGAAVRVYLNTADKYGKLTTSSVTSNTTVLPGWVFTGIFEDHGSTVVAEVAIHVK